MPEKIQQFIASNSLSMNRNFSNQEEKIKLHNGERSVLGYFPSSTKANQALEQIRAMGFEIAQLDQVSRYGVSNNSEYNSPLIGTASTQTGLTLSSADIGDVDDPSSRVLLGADPSVSGTSSRGYGKAGGYPFLVTVVTSDDRASEVARIMEENGGYV